MCQIEFQNSSYPNEPCLLYARGVIDGEFKDETIFSGLVDAMVKCIDKQKQNMESVSRASNTHLVLLNLLILSAFTAREHTEPSDMFYNYQWPGSARGLMG